MTLDLKSSKDDHELGITVFKKYPANVKHTINSKFRCYMEIATNEE